MRILALPMIIALALAPSTSAMQDFDAGGAAHVAGDFEMALREFEPLAEQGDAQPQNYPGQMYRNGRGVPQDYMTAQRA